MPTIRDRTDYERCLLEILRASGGRASRGQVLREFERRYYSSVPREHQEPAPGARSPAPPWQHHLDEACHSLEQRKIVFAPDPELWELP